MQSAVMKLKPVNTVCAGVLASRNRIQIDHVTENWMIIKVGKTVYARTDREGLRKAILRTIDKIMEQ
jgi:hypothetical protein